jgi:ParB family transcriptional regulator, chromosome partitioning protein
MSKRRASLSDRPVVAAAGPRATDDLVLGKERARQAVEELPLRAIMPNRLQPRTQPNPEGLRELAESIRQHGVLEPVIVRAIALTEYEGAGRRYELVAGERRWRASALAEQLTIPAIVVSNATDDQAMIELAITENLQREDLHPLDEAMAFGRMQSELGYSYAQIAERLGKSKGYVQNRMRLLHLAEDLQLLVAERPDTLAHVYEIARITDPAARAELIAAVRDDALSRAATRARVQSLLQPATEAAQVEPESYFQKYDRDEHHENEPRSGAKGREAGDTETRRHGDTEQDNPRIHAKGREAGDTETQRHGDTEQDNPRIHAKDAKETADPRSGAVVAGALLTAQERATVIAVTSKVEQLLDDVSVLMGEDWAVLSPLALRLSDLLRRVGQAQAQKR